MVKSCNNNCACITEGRCTFAFSKAKPNNTPVGNPDKMALLRVIAIATTIDFQSNDKLLLFGLMPLLCEKKLLHSLMKEKKKF
jgi:hypothetical protein